jgi:hypothetical protein
VPLRALGLGAGLLGPTSSPLMLLGASPNGGGGSETNDPSARRSRRRLSSSNTPAPPRAEKLLTAPTEGRNRGAGSSGGGVRSHAGRLGTSGRRVGDSDPTVGVPTVGLTNRHAALIESRQPSQDRGPQPWIIAERRDALGKDQGLRNEGLTSNPLH